MKQRWKKRACLMIAVLFLCSGLTVHAEDEQVKVSDKEYLVSLQSANTIFISNDKPVSSKVGTKMFLMYTVEEVTKNTVDQSGVIGTSDHDAGYPYTGDGRIEYSNESLLFEEGYTYVYRFEKTAEGFAYQCAKMKGKEAEYVNFTSSQGQEDTPKDYSYYGIWVDGGREAGVTALLNHVHCYDEDGNDLGIHFNRSTGLIQDEANALLDVHLTVDTSYSFQLVESNTLTIANKYPATTDVVYMEYEVEDVTQDLTIQQGVSVTRAPKENYPHAGGKGLLTYTNLEADATNKALLKKGGKYFICFAKKADGYDAMIQCTLNGETETFSFSNTYGTYDPSFQYFGLWFGDGTEANVSASIQNFKCYDSKGNSLGVQMRDKTVTISLHGEIEDYSKSKATYYCKENDTFLILQDDKKVTKQIGSTKENGTYKIMNRDELHLALADGKESYDYTSLMITDEEGSFYQRMKDYQVTFVTGGEKIETKAEAATGYRVPEPEQPTKDGNTFKGWYFGDGSAFDFDTVVTESMTLYAKWQDGDGNEYLAVDGSGEGSRIPTSVIITVAAVVVLLAAGVCGCVVIGKRGRK